MSCTTSYIGDITVPAANLKPLADALLAVRPDAVDELRGSGDGPHVFDIDNPIHLITATLWDEPVESSENPDGSVTFPVEGGDEGPGLPPLEVIAPYATARIEYLSDEAGNQHWMEVCSGGAVHTVSGVVSFPGLPDELTMAPTFDSIAQEVTEQVQDGAEFKGLDGPDAMGEIVAVATALREVVPDFAYFLTLDDDGSFDGAAFGMQEVDGLYRMKSIPFQYLAPREAPTGLAAVESYLRVMVDAYRTVQPLQ